MIDGKDRTLEATDMKGIYKYLDPAFLDVNIGYIMEQRGELVNTPEEANVILDDKVKVITYNQIVIRSYELEKLVALVNEK